MHFVQVCAHHMRVGVWVLWQSKERALIKPTRSTKKHRLSSTVCRARRCGLVQQGCTLDQVSENAKPQRIHTGGGAGEPSRQHQWGSAHVQLLHTTPEREGARGVPKGIDGGEARNAAAAVYTRAWWPQNSTRVEKLDKTKSPSTQTHNQTEGLGWGKDSLRRCARLALLRHARTARRWWWGGATTPESRLQRAAET